MSWPKMLPWLGFQATHRGTPSLDSLEKFGSSVGPKYDTEPSEPVDVETQAFLLQSGDNAHKYQVPKRQWMLRALIILITGLFLVSYAEFAMHYFRSGQGEATVCQLGREHIYNNAPIIYEDRRFHRAGFHTDPSKAGPFEGKPNDKNNAEWDRLLTVGFVSISDMENSRLLTPSAINAMNPSEHVVEVEIFHQLHCLKRLRNEIWFRPASAEENWPHLDHCIDYLRQVIMCHGDIAPITMGYSEELSNFYAYHSDWHRCRNFEAIFNWAEERNNTGLPIDGNHVDKVVSGTSGGHLMQ